MIEALAHIVADVPEKNSYFGDREYRAEKVKLQESGDGPERFATLVSIARRALYLGKEKEAIETYQAALKWLDETPHDLDPALRLRMDIFASYWLGISYMRLAETENCCARNTPDSCVLPIRGDGIHSQTEGATNAIQCFKKVLEIAQPNTKEYQRARWLLNIAYMTLGSYPDQVPSQHLIDPAFFESSHEFPEFRNIARQLGIDTFGCSGSAVADDFDNDGDLDLLVTDFDPAAQLRYFRNDRELGFVDATQDANLIGITGGLNINQADFNNDGWVDVFIMRGGWFSSQSEQPNSLLRNEGNGKFTDITFDAGLADEHFPTQTSSWADFDLDGDLDIFIGNERYSRDAPCQLFRNNGDQTFTDVTRQAGIATNEISKAVIWGDYDGDRWPDIYVSNLSAPNNLYRNNGDGTFTDVAFQLRVFNPIESFPCWFWDFDNDGMLDLYVSSYGAHMEHFANFAFKATETSEKAKLYRNTGNGLEDVAEDMGLNIPMAPMGSNFGDINNDGFLDFYLGTGWPDFDELMPNLFFLNLEGKRFKNVTMDGRFGHLQKGHGIVFADFDQDGDQDIFQEMGGAFPGDKYFNALFENPGFGNSWIIVSLQGQTTNRSAIGARVRIEFEEAAKKRTVYRHVNSGGTFGANPLRQHIGLGKCELIKLLEIYWPASDSTQRFENVPVNQLVRIVEGENEYHQQRYEPFAFAGKK